MRVCILALKVDHDGCITAAPVPAQIEEIKASIKFQLKKVLCLGVAIGHVAMADKVIAWLSCIWPDMKYSILIDSQYHWAPSEFM